MKIGAVYNLFDGVENLPLSLKGIRADVDYIGVIYQRISNFGNRLPYDVLPILEKLLNDGWIDFIEEYQPKIGSGHPNELAKRNKGLDLAIKNGCTHYMTIDADEIYIPSEFANLKKTVISSGFELILCSMKTYYKYHNCVLSPDEGYYVPTIYQIGNRRFEKSASVPFLIDPTRKMAVNKAACFVMPKVNCQMHHLSWIRDDINLKLMNSSARQNFKNHGMDKIADAWDKFIIGQHPEPYPFGFVTTSTKDIRSYFELS